MNKQTCPTEINTNKNICVVNLREKFSPGPRFEVASPRFSLNLTTQDLPDGTLE